MNTTYIRVFPLYGVISRSRPNSRDRGSSHCQFQIYLIFQQLDIQFQLLKGSDIELHCDFSAEFICCILFLYGLHLYYFLYRFYRIPFVATRITIYLSLRSGASQAFASFGQSPSTIAIFGKPAPAARKDL